MYNENDSSKMNNKNKTRYWILLTLTLMLLTSALTCFILLFTGNPFRKMIANDSNAKAVNDYMELLNAIESLYIGEYDTSDLSTAAMRAAVEALDDRWSYYMTPEEYAQYLISSRNQYAGIGVSVVIDEITGGMAVIYTFSNSPADLAGIVGGDIIIGIDGEDISGLSLEEMKGLLARQIGDTVEIEVLREDGSKEILSVVYDLIFDDPISYQVLDNNIGYIRIKNFEGSSSDGFIYAVNALIEQGVIGIIYDVRYNGGGRVNEMTQMLDYLLPEGEIFVSVGHDGREDITWSDPAMIDLPTVVLVDRYSFSAAEYFAATLMEYDYAQIVGEQTSGKSRSQRTEILPHGGALHISTSQYLTRNRVALYDAGGLVPNYILSLSDDDFNHFLSGRLNVEEDAQITFAISLLTD